MTSVASPPLTAKEAEERKRNREASAAKRKVGTEEVKSVLADLRHLALFPSIATPDEIRAAAVSAIRVIQRKRSKPTDMDFLEGLDAC